MNAQVKYAAKRAGKFNLWVVIFALVVLGTAGALRAQFDEGADDFRPRILDRHMLVHPALEVRRP